ncbi:MAG: nicotinate-nucleotide adenylyltransferase [Burkholderiales bacterium]|jgi:nicotinate-nucleotide adenylyltransferase|nr:nicotinate-nucleotide adenylyltransferase [Burkholderiales bacterium]
MVHKTLLYEHRHTNPLLPLRAMGLLGGTFDPVHEGHLAIARAVNAHFGLDHVRLIPAHVPVHRPTPGADACHRLAMLRLAVAPHAELVVDTREFDSLQQNYTLWTLQSLRAEYPEASLLWIIGEDAFAQLPTWHRWPELFDATHFVIINRAGERAPEALPEVLQAAVLPRLTDDKRALTSRPAGLVYRLTLPPQPASSTLVRAALAAGRVDSIAGLLPAPVLAYIARHSLYQTTSHGS